MSYNDPLYFFPSRYYMLPFRFQKLTNETEILTNDFGDYIICKTGTARQIAQKEIDLDHNSTLAKDLFSKNFISDRPIPFILDNLGVKYRTKKAFLDNFTSLHIFVLTIRCNQNCKYCQVSSRTDAETTIDMSFKTIEDSVKLLFQSPSKHLTIEMQGGEPTLVPDSIKFLVTKCEERNALYQKKLKYVLCTNLINISDDVLSFCKEYNILISTSLDGPKSVHDANRICFDYSSYETVLLGIKKAREHVGIENVSALMTTTKNSFNLHEEIVNCYIENGFTNIFLRAINPYGNAKRKSDFFYTVHDFVEFYKKSLEYIINLNLKGIFFIEDFTTIILKKIFTPFPIGFVDLQSPSGVINGVIVYNYDGGLYVSDEARMLAEEKDYTFKLGSVDQTYNSLFLGKSSLNIANHWASESYVGCSDCAFQPYCGADPVRNHSSQGDMEGFRSTSSYCQKHFEIIKHIFNLLDDNYNKYFPVFQSWVSNKPLI